MVRESPDRIRTRPREMRETQSTPRIMYSAAFMMRLCAALLVCMRVKYRPTLSRGDVRVNAGTHGSVHGRRVRRRGVHGRRGRGRRVDFRAGVLAPGLLREALERDLARLAGAVGERPRRISLDVRILAFLGLCARIAGDGALHVRHLLERGAEFLLLRL